MNDKKWFVVHAYSGFEKSVMRALTKVSWRLGIGVGLQRNWPIGRSVWSCAGAVLTSPASTFWNRPVCRTVGRIR